jgi:hypothetical protein
MIVRFSKCLVTLLAFHGCLISAAFAFDQCKGPRTYEVVSVDKRFGVSLAQAKAAARRAADMWHSAGGKIIFQQSSNPQIKISLIFTEAQEAHQLVKELNEEAELISKSIDIHNRHQDEINRKVANHNKEVEDLNKEFAELANAISQWNSKPTSQKEERARLQRDQEALLKRKKELESIGKQLQEENTFLAKQRADLEKEQKKYDLDRDMVKYVVNGVLSFQRAGVYQRSAKGEETIKIFVMGDLDELKNVLAHEFGHALGIQHLADVKALMHAELSEANRNLKLVSRADIREFRRICH